MEYTASVRRASTTGSGSGAATARRSSWRQQRRRCRVPHRHRGSTKNARRRPSLIESRPTATAATCADRAPTGPPRDSPPGWSTTRSRCITTVAAPRVGRELTAIVTDVANGRRRDRGGEGGRRPTSQDQRWADGDGNGAADVAKSRRPRHRPGDARDPAVVFPREIPAVPAACSRPPPGCSTVRAGACRRHADLKQAILGAISTAMTHAPDRRDHVLRLFAVCWDMVVNDAKALT